MVSCRASAKSLSAPSIAGFIDAQRDQMSQTIGLYATLFIFIIQSLWVYLKWIWAYKYDSENYNWKDAAKRHHHMSIKITVYPLYTRRDKKSLIRRWIPITKGQQCVTDYVIMVSTITELANRTTLGPRKDTMIISRAPPMLYYSAIHSLNPRLHSIWIN